MEERDWYLKEMQKLSKLIDKLVGFRDKGETKQAFDLLDELYLPMLGLNHQLLASLTDEELVQLIQEKALKPAVLQELAELLVQEGAVWAAESDTPESQARFRRAIVVFNYLSVLERRYSFEREDKIKRLTKLLK